MGRAHYPVGRGGGPREYGASGPSVVLMHGGPGAPGSLAAVARALAGEFHVIEPFERRSAAGRPLTVDLHVEDLGRLLEDRLPGERPALVGHSWGAMMALAFAAAHPGSVSSLLLVGCGTFDLAARGALEASLAERIDVALRHRLAEIERGIVDPDERLAALGRALLPAYSVDLVATDLELERCDARGHRESWDDMLGLQRAGVYPQAFAAIEESVLMLHGVEDPHPGELVRASLAPHLRQLEYREWPRCGHYPWLERAAREPFFEALREWLRAHPG